MSQYDDEFDNPYRAPAKGPDPRIGVGQDLWSVAPAYGSFLARFTAAFLDGLILMPVGFVVGAVSGVMIQASGGDPAAPGAQVFLQLLGLVINVAYNVGLISSSMQATVGKMALGLKVTDIEGRRLTVGRALARELSKILSGLILFIGYLMAAFTEKKQALHDMIAGTLVVKSR